MMACPAAPRHRRRILSASGSAGAVLLVLLTLHAPARATAQAIAVVANRSFRPTAVLLPHTRFVVGADSSVDGVALIRELGVAPVTFAGTVRIEGIQPGARGGEPQPFADTVRFEPDGRVVLALADAAGRPPMTAEVIGARGAAGGRIAITASGFPLGRVMLVTISPADIYELTFRRVGLGVRDRLRIDERAGFAYLADTTAGPTTVAIGFGRGTRGRILEDVATVVVTRDFGGEAGRERRQVGAVALALDPDRAGGVARAEVVFGVGNSEAEAAQAARTASDEPAPEPASSGLRVRTPSSGVDLLVRHTLSSAWGMLNWDVVNGERPLVASAARPTVRPTEAWPASSVALQRGDTSAVCGTYRLLRRSSGDAGARVELAPRLGSRGRSLVIADSSDASADASMILLAHACYLATRDASFLRGQMGWLAGAAERARQAPAALTGQALGALADLNDELPRIAGSERNTLGDSLRAEAAHLMAADATPESGQPWRGVAAEAQRALSREYGRLSLGDMGGASLAAGGRFLQMLVGQVFGIAETLDHIDIAPHLEGVADDQVWQLDNWLLGGGDTLNLSYRPADRAVRIRVTTSRRLRLVLRFPWLSPASCVAAVRGDEAEHLPLIAQRDGSFYTDLRSALAPARLTVSADGCP